MRENSQAWQPSWQTTSATHAESPTEPDRGFGGGLRNKNEAEIEAEIHKYVMNARRPVEWYSLLSVVVKKEAAS